MKNFITLFVLSVFVHSFSYAQMKKGSLLLGGDLAFNFRKTADSSATNNTNNYRTTGFSLSPALALAVKDNFFVGIRLNYGHSSSTQVNSDHTESHSGYNSYGGGIFLRQYKNLSPRFYFFTEENVGAFASKSTSDYNGALDKTEIKSFNLNFGITPGVSYAITPHFQLETGLQNIFVAFYQHDKNGAAHSDSFQVSTALTEISNSIFLGARFLFGGN